MNCTSRLMGILPRWHSWLFAQFIFLPLAHTSPLIIITIREAQYCPFYEFKKLHIACPSHNRILRNSFTPLKVLGGLSSHISLPLTFTECLSAIQSVLLFLTAFFQLVRYTYISSMSCHGSMAHFSWPWTIFHHANSVTRLRKHRSVRPHFGNF